MVFKISPTPIKKILGKINWQELLAILILFLAFVFFRSERKEMSSILPQLRQANSVWIFAGVGLTFIYVLLQALMYQTSFRVLGEKLKFREAIELFLKRNFLSVFLPAGGISSLAYTPKNIQQEDYGKNVTHKASAIYGFVGILTVFLVGIPVIAYVTSTGKNFGVSWLYIIGLAILLIGGFWSIKSFRSKGFFYQLLIKSFPKITQKLEEYFDGAFDRKYFYITIGISVLIEFCGIFHLLIAMFAFGVDGSFTAAAIGYTVSVLLMLISPFLRGLGAVEFTLIYILGHFGFSHSQGLGITLLYRIFEFWFPLLLGISAFMWNGRKIIARLSPALAIFTLGLINIISVITPPLAERLEFGRIFLSEDMMHFSKILTLMSGIFLLVTSAYLIRGLKTGWYFALFLSILSFFGNLIKALDYEEASLSLMIILLLMVSRKEYIIKSNRKYVRLGFSWFFALLGFVTLFNFLSFYFIDKRHFGLDFTWKESLYYTFHSFLLLQKTDLIPKTGFAKDFQIITYILGIFSWLLLIFSIFNVKKIFSEEETEKNYEDAKKIVKVHGISSLDYFKTLPDKQLFFSATCDGFVSYRTAINFAFILEEPVCEKNFKKVLIGEFENHCKENGLQAVYYRVDEDSLLLFKIFNKHQIFIGQEAIMNIDQFTLDGKERKSLRNSLNALFKKNYHTEILSAPQDAKILEEVQNVSNEWLQNYDIEEMIFSQGMFDRLEIRDQDLIVLKNSSGKIEAFLNVIPDFAPSECTYDLIRKTVSAPSGSMDALLVKLVEYAKAKNIKCINLGLTPLAGLNKPNSAAEEILKLVYNRVGNFKHYKSLRQFKEKYANRWDNKYLIYTNDFDLLQIPGVLKKIIKPK